MEIPYQGRATINESFDGVEIIIPPKKNWFIIAFLSVWLSLMLFFGIFIGTALSGVQGGRFVINILVIPFLANLFFAAKRLYWNIAGKEIITISQGLLTINRKGDILKRTKSYELAKCRDFRAQEEEMPILHYNTRTAAMFRKKANPGTIKFEYDYIDTIQFGDWLPQTDGNYILERLRSKKLISGAPDALRV
jgi:hypothetical protein